MDTKVIDDLLWIGRRNYALGRLNVRDPWIERPSTRDYAIQYRNYIRTSIQQGKWNQVIYALKRHGLCIIKQMGYYHDHDLYVRNYMLGYNRRQNRKVMIKIEQHIRTLFERRAWKSYHALVSAYSQFEYRNPKLIPELTNKTRSLIERELMSNEIEHGIVIDNFEVEADLEAQLAKLVQQNHTYLAQIFIKAGVKLARI